MIARVVDESGSGPPLVYVPGIDGTGRLLLSTAERLTSRFRLICLRYAPSSAASNIALISGPRRRCA